ILGNQNLTLKEIFDLLSEITGIPSPKMRVPNWVAEGYARAENFWSIRVAGREPFAPIESVRMSRHKMWFDSAKSVRELGLPQNPIKAALARAVEWFRENNYVAR